MGFFDSLLKGLGFEGGSNEKKQKKPIAEKAIPTNYNSASYDLSKKKKDEPIVSQQTENAAGIKVFEPKNQVDIQEVVIFLKSGTNIIVNLSGFDATDRTRALDFLSGAIFTLDGKIQILDGNLYLLSTND